MKITFLTLFPQMVESIMNTSILKRAQEKGILTVEIIDFRNYSADKYHRVDDTPYGGGAGMLLQVEPIAEALKDCLQSDSYVLLTSPKALPFKQSKAYELAQKKHLVFICGHYEGIDERITQYVDENISLGDYILTGGELAACVISDTVVRLLEEAINQDSLKEESYENHLLEYPQYTKPVDYHGLKVPAVLLSGHHQRIADWRFKMAVYETLRYRKDLLKNRSFSAREIKLLKELAEDLKNGRLPQ